MTNVQQKWLKQTTQLENFEPIKQREKRYQNLCILFRLRYSKAVNGLGMIYCRLTVDGKRGREFSTCLKVYKKDFDTKKQLVLFTDQEHHLKNMQMLNIAKDIRAIMLRYFSDNVHVTVNKILNEYRADYSYTKFTFKHCAEMLANYKQQGVKETTLINYKNLCNHFENYKKGLLVEDINESIFESFIYHLKQQGYHTNHIYKIGYFVKQVLIYAVKKGIINKNPLALSVLKKDNNFENQKDLIMSLTTQLGAVFFEANNLKKIIEELLRQNQQLKDTQTYMFCDISTR